MRISFRLEGIGCARARVSDSGRAAELTTTYVRDALGDLVLTTGWLVAREKDEVRCSWAEEPGEFRWVVTRDGRRAHVRILWFDDPGEDEPGDRGTPVLECTPSVADFGRAVERCALDVLDRYGEQGSWRSGSSTRSPQRRSSGCTRR